MNKRRRKLRTRLLDLASLLSTALAVATAWIAFRSIDAGNVHRLGNIEITIRPDAIVTHHVTAAEDAYRQALGIYNATDAAHEHRLRELDSGMRQLDPDDPAYEAAVHRFYDVKAERDAYRDTAPKPPKQQHDDLSLPTVYLIPIEIAVAIILCFLSWRRHEAAVRRRAWRRVRWKPHGQLTLFRSAWRFAFLTSAVVSLLFALGVGFLWIRSYSASDNFDRMAVIGAATNPTYRVRTLNTFRGGVWLAQTDFSPPASNTPANIPNIVYRQVARAWSTRGDELRQAKSPAADDPNPSLAWHGLTLSRTGSTQILVAYWVPLLALLMVPMLWLITHIRIRQLPESGKCLCGYDLTGNVSGVCPECGAKQAGSTASS